MEFVLGTQGREQVCAVPWAGPINPLLICTCIKNYPMVPNDLTGGYRIEYRVGMVGRLLYFEINWDTLLAYPIRWSGFSLSTLSDCDLPPLDRLSRPSRPLATGRQIIPMDLMNSSGDLLPIELCGRSLL